MAARLPVVYVRGFAGSTSGIDSATDDPFYGFNLGSTHVRVGAGGEPAFYQFESPLLRLMIDHGYQLFVHGGQAAWLSLQADRGVEPATIWVHRFYDDSASTWGDKARAFSLERAAADLAVLVDLVRLKTGAPRVHLVAHSMGGLVCRCLIQKVLPDRGDVAAEVVDRLFTFATPHGGIAFDVGFGLLERIRDTFGVGGGDIFGPERMWEYLNPGDPGPVPQDFIPQVVPENAFPLDRIFTLIGTNSDDYDAGRGLVAKSVGVKSDGLVQIEKAYIPGAKFAFVHRSHSGRYGIVNSEEGYQNLRRFLFGDLEVKADLVGLRLPSRHSGEVVWQAEVELAVRGVPVMMHQQLSAHHCPVVLQAPDEASDRPEPLVTTFLIADPSSRPQDRGHARYTLHVRIISIRQRRGVFDFRDHLEQFADLDDVLVVDIGERDGRLVAWARWNSSLDVPLRDYEPTGSPLEDQEPAPGVWVATIALPEAARAFLGDGAAVQLTVSDRGDAGRTGLGGRSGGGA